MSNTLAVMLNQLSIGQMAIYVVLIAAVVAIVVVFAIRLVMGM